VGATVCSPCGIGTNSLGGATVCTANPVTNTNANGNANGNTNTNTNGNSAVNGNTNNINNTATGGNSGDSISNAVVNNTVNISNPITANIGATVTFVPVPAPAPVPIMLVFSSASAVPYTACSLKGAYQLVSDWRKPCGGASGESFFVSTL
jgi:hypothetical protein